MSSEPIRYAVVGLGRAGWDIHVKSLRDRADAKIVAVVDPVQERRDEAAVAFGCKTYTSLSRVLKQSDIEVVVIATPSVMHCSDTKKSLKAGKHVVVEKPMAMSVAEADSMIRVANETGKKLFVHQNYRFFPEFHHLKGVIESGILGRLYHIRYSLINFSRRNDWQTLVRNGGGVLNNTCPHSIDQAIQFAGAPIKDCLGDLQQIASAGDVEDHVKALMRAENGVTIDMEVSSAQNLGTAPYKWVLSGTCGTLVMDGAKSTIRWFDPQAAPPLEVVDGPAADRKYGNADKLPWQEKTVDATAPVSCNFYDNVFGVIRRGEPQVITSESVREVIRVIALIRKGTRFPGKVTTNAPAASV
ncbi:MAG: Gfo/Idh/MocA family oxidoreductase [Phycisphaeraceae bacterium]|nr:Gfo/Idh/MocA family oxidoreductase [Phycisphaeraceae bacterium]